MKNDWLHPGDFHPKSVLNERGLPAEDGERVAVWLNSFGSSHAVQDETSRRPVVVEVPGAANGRKQP